MKIVVSTLIYVLLSLILFVQLVAKESKSESKLTAQKAQQNALLQQKLLPLFPDSEGYRITGALDSHFGGGQEIVLLYQTVMVICTDPMALQKGIRKIKDSKFIKIKSLQHDIDKARGSAPAGYRGAIIKCIWDDQEETIQILTLQQQRWLLWAKEIYGGKSPKLDPKAIRAYATAVSDYLDAIDRGNTIPSSPRAADFGLPETVDLYPPFAHADDYHDLLRSNAEIKTDFVRGTTAFIPTDSTLRAFITDAPAEKFSDQQEVMLQWRFQRYASAGGDWRSLQTMTAASFSALPDGEYFFAVGLDSVVRCGALPAANSTLATQAYELTGYEAMLFPGESVLTAGTFTKEAKRVAAVKINSTAYFFNTLSPTLGQDLALHSDHYLATLGHLFRALDRMGISFHSVLISKF